MVAAAVLVAVGGMLAFGVSSFTAGTAEPSLDCVGDDGGAAYVTDSGLTVFENDDDITFGDFPDNETVEFQNGLIALSASGESEARLDDGTGTLTCLADVDATDNAIAVAPDGENDVTLEGEFDAFVFRDVVYDTENEETDLVYDAADMKSLTVEQTGLDDGTEVLAVDTDDSELDASTVTDGSVTFDGLPDGEHEVDLRVSETEEDDECVDRRNISRGEEDYGCPTDKDLRRGETREDSDRDFDRDSDTERRDRSRQNRGR